MVSFWFLGAEFFLGLKFNLWNRSELLDWVRFSGTQCDFPCCRGFVVLSFPQNYILVLNYLNSCRLIWLSRVTRVHRGRDDSESLNKLRVSEQYVTRCLGMAFSLDFLPSLELYPVKYLFYKWDVDQGSEGWGLAVLLVWGTKRVVPEASWELGFSRGSWGGLSGAGSGWTQGPVPSWANPRCCGTAMQLFLWVLCWSAWFCVSVEITVCLTANSPMRGRFLLL